MAFDTPEQFWDKTLHPEKYNVFGRKKKRGFSGTEGAGAKAKPTPTPTKQRKINTQTIQKREKRVRQLMDSGKTKKSARAQAVKEIRGIAEEGLHAQYAEQDIEAAGAELGELGAFKEAGEARELQVKEDVEGINIGGVGVGEIAVGAGLPELDLTFKAMRNRAVLDMLDLDTIQNFSLEEFREHPEIMSEPYLLELVKTEMDLEALKRGEIVGSQLGILVEGLVGGELVKWVPGVTTPNEAVRNIIKELDVVEGDLREQGRWADQGNIDPYTALANANKYEERILYLQSKLRILISQSPELKNAPEGVDYLTQKAQGILNNLEASRNRAGSGLLTKSIINPDQAFLEFQKMKNEKK